MEELELELSRINNIKEVYARLSIYFKEKLPNSVIILCQLDEKMDEAYVFDLIGLKKTMFCKLISILGLNPIGKRYKNTEHGRKYFYSSKTFDQFKGDLYQFSEGLMPKWVCKLLESACRINNIYTLGLNIDDLLLGTIMVLPRKDDVHKLKEVEKQVPFFSKRMKEILENYKYGILGCNIRHKFSQTLVQNISHEIRTPLNGIVGLMDAGLQLLENNEDTKHLTNVIWKSSNELTNKLDNLLLVADLESNLTQFKFEQLRTKDIINTLKLIIRKLENEFNDRSIILKCDLSDSELDLIFLVDIYYFEVAVQELVRNALKFSEDDVVISIDNVDGYFELKVSDRGVGLTKKEQAELFQLFYKNDKLEEFKHGLGVGLSIVKQISEKQNWHIKMRSKEGMGTSVSLEIPQ